MVALAFQILHFERFVDEHKISLTQREIEYLTDLKTQPRENLQLGNDLLQQIFGNYEKYEAETLKGNHWRTAQIYITFIRFVKYYLMLNASIRTSDLELLKYMLPFITNLFFVFNQQNYSRFLVKYHDNLLRIDITHPGLKLLLNMAHLESKELRKLFPNNLLT